MDMSSSGKMLEWNIMSHAINTKREDIQILECIQNIFNYFSYHKLNCAFYNIILGRIRFEVKFRALVKKLYNIN